MRRATSILLVAPLMLSSRVVRGQGRDTASTFLTGTCPTRSADSVKWDQVVTTPDQPAHLLPEPRPQFPMSVHRDGYKGKVVLGMVIDTSGRVMAGTVSVTASTDPTLSAWACLVAGDLRFTPALVANRPVNALSEQPLSFTATVIRRRPPALYLKLP